MSRTKRDSRKATTKSCAPPIVPSMSSRGTTGLPSFCVRAAWWVSSPARVRGGGGGAGSGDEGVAGVVDGGGDLGPVGGPVDGDGDQAGGQVDGDALHALEPPEAGGDGAFAVGAGHAADLEGRGADE